MYRCLLHKLRDMNSIPRTQHKGGEKKKSPHTCYAWVLLPKHTSGRQAYTYTFTLIFKNSNNQESIYEIM